MLISALTTLYGLWRKLTVPRDLSVEREYLEYEVDPSIQCEPIEDAFWRRESRDWSVLTSLWVDVTRRRRAWEIPQCVTRTILRIKYNYGGRVYKVITNDLNYEWPPVEDGEGEVKFSLPIQNAWLCDDLGRPLVDITTKIRRYAGPNNDFHNQDVRLRDLLYYDEDVLKKKYPILKVKNILGITKMIDTLEGTTFSLRGP